MGGNYEKILYKDYMELYLRYSQLSDEHKQIVDENKYLKHLAELNNKLIESLKNKNNDLLEEVARLQSKLNKDGTNSNIPTSQTPINKKKVIPNSRKKSNKKRGGQPGHTKNKLEAFEEDEVTQVIDVSEEICPYCGGKLDPTDEVVTKDEFEYELVVMKKRYRYHMCKCSKCNATVKTPIPKKHKEENQYGSNVKALCLTLANIGNVPINKIKRIVYGLSANEMDLSEGYISKLQKVAAKELEPFIQELREHCMSLPLLHWDDTVINIDVNRGCLRFYGDKNVALYTAHSHKNKAGLDEDGILSTLPESTIVVHDHNKVNYNQEYDFMNAECNAHLLRDLQNMQQISQHTWCKKMTKLLTDTNQIRKEAIESGKKSFTDEETKVFFDTYNEILIEASEEQKADCSRYYGKNEQNLILRLMEYKDNYCMWVVNFDVPFTNNISERSLRGAKSKQKISGQFQSLQYAQCYANIRSYIETCRRNGLNETIALQLLSSGTPLTLKQILTSDVD